MKLVIEMETKFKSEPYTGKTVRTVEVCTHIEPSKDGELLDPTNKESILQVEEYKAAAEYAKKYGDRMVIGGEV